MISKKILIFFVLLCVPFLSNARAVSVKMPSVPVDAQQWITEHFAKGKIPPFSFVLDGKQSSDFIRKWKYSAAAPESVERGVTEYLFTYVDPQSALQVECRARAYRDFNAVDWVLNFTNDNTSNSPVIEQVRVMDIDMKYPRKGTFKLHYADGNHISKEDFHPRSLDLSTGENKYMAPEGGRSSQGDFLPFFNIESPAAQGVMVAVGWTGTWYADVKMVSESVVSLNSGMKTLKTFLYPDESIRTPSISLMFWNGEDRMIGHNKFRRYVLAHHSRKIDGKFAEYPISNSFNYKDPAPCQEYGCLTEEYATAMVQRYEQFGLVNDVFWLDAGWSSGAGDFENGRTWANTAGNWSIDTTRFPRGLKPVADAVHKVGSKFMVWFEPERVMRGTEWAEQHPQWMLDIPGSTKDTYLLFDLGNKQAGQWMSKYIGDMIEQNDIDYYRQDFNMEPDKYWAANDVEGRSGIKEIRHIEGLYAFWDYLLDRFPDLLIDNCASGGRRIDLETISRSAPLWRSDYYHYDDPDGYQGHTYGLNFFLPLHGTGILLPDKYSFRSSMSSALICNWKVTDPKSSIYEMRARLSEYKEIRPYYYEDYYPLTGIDSLTRDNIWISYQMHRPADDSGIVVAFRRATAPDASITVRLSGVDPQRNYSLRDYDTDKSITVSGKELRDGYVISIPDPKGSMLLRYQVTNK